VLIKFFSNGKGAGAGPVGYLVAERVLAYDGNRDLIRDADGQPVTVTRDPLPDVNGRVKVSQRAAQNVATLGLG
jgi:hypothetical protein